MISDRAYSDEASISRAETRPMHVGVIALADIDYALDLANALVDAGTRVSVYVSGRHAIRAMGDADQPVERLYQLGLLPRSVQVRLFHAPRMRDPRSIAVYRELAKAIREDGVDVVHPLVGSGELWLSVLTWLLRDLPVASTMILPKPNVGQYPPGNVARVVNTLLAHGSDVVIVNGDDQIEMVQQMYRVPRQRIDHVRLGPRTTSARWSTRQITEEAGTILFFGRIARHKGLEYLVRAQPAITRAVPYARIVIAGNGAEEMDRCQHLMEDPSKFEVHEGFVSNEQLTELFQRASVVVLPYITASTSGILMTAYVFGKPVVVTQVGSLPQYVGDGETGLLVAPADSDQLATAIVKLLSNDALRHEMGESARHWAEREQEAIARQSLDAYKKAISIHHK